ncbi:MAG TPA: sigma-70 family RNA polymerase sigma factor [Polyangiales bacterium]|nr:sigma-70 family RNA polymerase sigma factor [Polyangiales bacterium]
MTTGTLSLELPPHYFRHEFGRLVSVLLRRYGMRRIELCEDAAQAALMRAVQSWSVGSMPDNRGAWLYRVASNHVLDVLRREKRDEAFEPDVAPEPDASESTDSVYLESEVSDDLLRLLFVSADPALAPESQLVLTLKVLCGFNTEEIALRLFQSEEAVHKRLQRARSRFRLRPLELETPSLQELADRLPRVLHLLYLVFNEGYSSAQPDRLIRCELCEEAVRLASILVAHPVGAMPQTYALLALMYLHAARFEARIDGAGGLLLLEEQDRSLWDAELIQLGLSYLQRAAPGERMSRYHLEAAIAAEHCLATSYADARWDEIARLYAELAQLNPSPLHVLNRAIALAEWKGPEAGLRELEALKPPSWLLGYYLWDATLGELYRRSGDRERAVTHLERALGSAPTNAEKELLERRLSACNQE